MYKKVTFIKVIGLSILLGFMTSCGSETTETVEDATEEVMEETMEEEIVEEVVEEVTGGMDDSTAVEEVATSGATGASDFYNFFENGGSDYSGMVFEFGETSTDGKTLSDDAKLKLDKVAEVMAAYPNAEIDVRGHTRKVGTAATNKISSKARALMVQEYLKGKGVAGKRMNTKGLGSSDLLSGIAEDDMSQKRISIILTKI